MRSGHLELVLPQCPSPFSAGGPEKFSILAKSGGLFALFEFLGRNGYFYWGEGVRAEDFLKVVFNC